MALTQKERILAEINRTAKENGGVPLGLRRFRQETGIRYHDWFGRYWVRWGDAVREAGFQANTLTSGYGEEALIERYIAFVRELGHIPVRGELLLKCRKDSSFPSEKTFRRLGGKQKLLNRVAEYCRNKSGFEDVLQLCRYKSPEGDSDVAGETQKASSETGCVYLLKAGRYYKIGKSNSIGRREYELAIQLPQRAATVHVIRTDDPTGIEAYWHKRFETKHKNGEWYELNVADVQAFKRRKFM